MRLAQAPRSATRKYLLRRFIPLQSPARENVVHESNPCTGRRRKNSPRRLAQTTLADYPAVERNVVDCLNLSAITLLGLKQRVVDRLAPPGEFGSSQSNRDRSNTARCKPDVLDPCVRNPRHRREKYFRDRLRVARSNFLRRKYNRQISPYADCGSIRRGKQSLLIPSMKRSVGNSPLASCRH